MKPVNRTDIQKYERVGVLTLEEGFALIAAPETRTTINDHVVSINSLRLRSFQQNGVKCAHVGCPYEGTYFAIERSLPGRSISPHKTFHLNLWGVDLDDGKPVLMTVDHILAKGLGGTNELSNTQTMCIWHNGYKSIKEGKLAEKTRKDQFESPLKFTYVGLKQAIQIRESAGTARRSFNFFLNDPMTWATNDFLDIIWKHAGFLCTEVRLVSNDFRHPEHEKLAHRYDLTFLLGRGLLESRNDVNALMRKIEADIRFNLNVTLTDTHFVIDDDGGFGGLGARTFWATVGEQMETTK